MHSSPSLIDRIESLPQRELYFFALFRVLMASLIVALVFSPLSALMSEAHHPVLAEAVSIGYLMAATGLLAWGRNERWLQPLVFWSAVADILAATLLTHALPDASAGISMTLLFNISAAATLLPLTRGMLLAVLLLLLLVAPCLNCLEAVKKPPPVAFKVMCLLPITIL